MSEIKRVDILLELANLMKSIETLKENENDPVTDGMVFRIQTHLLNAQDEISSTFEEYYKLKELIRR